MIDGDYFKQRARQAGVTSEDLGHAIGRDRSVISRIFSGARPLKPQEVAAFARLLNISTDEVLARSGMADPAIVRSMVAKDPAAASSDATRATADDAADPEVRNMAGLLGGGRNGLDIWIVKNRAMVLDGYVEGDYILVESKSFSPRSGDAVIAQVYDWQAGDAVTLFRRFEPPVLVASSAAPEDRKVHVVDGTNVTIRGVVVASWRGGVKH